MKSGCLNSPIGMKIEMARFVQMSDVEFYENPPGGSRVVLGIHTDRQSEPNRRSAGFQTCSKTLSQYRFIGSFEQDSYRELPNTSQNHCQRYKLFDSTTLNL
jgi:hypothetical protein